MSNALQERVCCGNLLGYSLQAIPMKMVGAAWHTPRESTAMIQMMAALYSRDIVLY